MTSKLTQRSAILGATVFLTVGLALGIEVLLSGPPHGPFAHSEYGHALGWFGLAAVAPTFVYPWKKQSGFKGPWPKHWFFVHISGGIFGTLLILIHAGWHLHALLPVMALLSLMAVTLSGIVGIALHRAAVRLLSDRCRDLAREGYSAEVIEQRVHELADHEQSYRRWQWFHAPLAAVFAVLALLHIGGALYFGGW
jgi:hypothetical protein